MGQAVSELGKRAELWGELADTLAAWVEDEKALIARQSADQKALTP